MGYVSPTLQLFDAYIYSFSVSSVRYIAGVSIMVSVFLCNCILTSGFKCKCILFNDLNFVWTVQSPFFLEEVLEVWNFFYLFGHNNWENQAVP